MNLDLTELNQRSRSPSPRTPNSVSSAPTSPSAFAPKIFLTGTADSGKKTFRRALAPFTRLIVSDQLFYPALRSEKNVELIYDMACFNYSCMFDTQVSSAESVVMIVDMSSQLVLKDLREFLDQLCERHPRSNPALIRDQTEVEYRHNVCKTFAPDGKKLLPFPVVVFVNKVDLWASREDATALALMKERFADFTQKYCFLCQENLLPATTPVKIVFGSAQKEPKSVVAALDICHRYVFESIAVEQLFASDMAEYKSGTHQQPNEKRQVTAARSSPRTLLDFVGQCFASKNEKK